MDSTSQQIIDSGLVDIAFGTALREPVEEYTFSIFRDNRNWLWLNAVRNGGAQASLLHEPPEPTMGVVLTKAQWELAQALAVPKLPQQVEERGR